MNITFLIILMVWLAMMVFIKNTFHINIKGPKKYLWLILSISAFSILLATVFGSDPHALWLALPFKFMIGPLLIWMVRPNFNKGSSRYLHLLPATVVFMIFTPIYAMDGHLKLELLHQSPWWVTGLELILIGQLLFYVIWTFRTKKLSRALVFGMLGYILFLGLAILANPVVPAELVWLIVLPFCLWSTRVKAENKVGEPGILQIVERAMEEEKLYKNKDLSLARMAQALGLSTNKISSALNNTLGIGYNDYVNGYRVDEAIKLLQNESNQRYTIEAISQMAGFRSLTTFNSAFKKSTGKTPKQFKV